MFIKFKKWLSGEITWQEEKVLRRKAKKDPFLSDAMEGYEQFPDSNHIEKIHQLNNRIRQRTSTSRSVYKRAIAATLLFVVTAGMLWFVNNSVFQTAASEMAHQSYEDRSAPIAKTPIKESTPIQPVEESNSAFTPVTNATNAKKIDNAVQQPSTSIPKEKVNKIIPKKNVVVSPTVPPIQHEEVITTTADKEQPPLAVEKRSRKIVAQTKSRSERSVDEIAIAQQSPPAPAVEEEMPALDYETADAIAITEYDTTEQYEATQQEADRSSVVLQAPISRSIFDPKQQVFQFLEENLQYPELALSNNINGFVRLQYRVDANGKLQDIEVIDSLGYGCDEEAIRLLQAIPFFVPNNQLDTLEIKFGK